MRLSAILTIVVRGSGPSVAVHLMGSAVVALGVIRVVAVVSMRGIFWNSP